MFLPLRVAALHLKVNNITTYNVYKKDVFRKVCHVFFVVDFLPSTSAECRRVSQTWSECAVLRELNQKQSLPNPANIQQQSIPPAAEYRE